MKFKVFTVILLGLCFLALGVMSGAIPVTIPDRTAADEPAAMDEAVPAAAIPTAKPMPQRTVPPKAGPTPAASASPSAGPIAAPIAATLPPETAAPSFSPVPSPADEPSPSPMPEPTASPAPTAAPASAETPTPTAAPAAATDEWEPEAVAVATTITWKNDPITNETAYAVDGHAMLRQPLAISLPAEGPQILIIHTHGTEAYTPDGDDAYEAVEPYRTTDTDHNVIRVGQALADALEGYGLDVLVDKELYDWPNYDGAYARSGAAIEGYLADYPSLSMVIDVHRDAIGDGEIMYGPVSDRVDPKTAQMMFVMGSDGALCYPNWEENLRLAMSLQGLLDEAYPHLMRPTTLCSSRYNQQLTAGSLLLEVGATGNTLDQALAAVDQFAQVAGPALAARVGA